jgi:hypothetical protein
MAQVTGTIQASPIYLPRRIARDVDKVTPDQFISRLPFDSTGITLELVSD